MAQILFPRSLYLFMFFCFFSSTVVSQNSISITSGLNLDHNEWLNIDIESGKIKCNWGLGLNTSIALSKKARIDYDIQAIVLPVKYKVNQYGAELINSLSYRTFMHSLSYRFTLFPNTYVGLAFSHQHNYSLQFKGGGGSNDLRNHFNMLGFAPTITYDFKNANIELRITKYLDIYPHMFFYKNDNAYSIGLWFRYPLFITT